MHPKRIIVPYRHEKKLKNYLAALAAAELEPVPLPASGKPQLNGASGLLLMGGTDVGPALYNASPLPETDNPDRERDAFELDILDQALHKKLPVFAICRGLQLLNVHAGGTLHQHLGSARHDDDEHEIEIEPGTLLAGIAGQSHWRVNSRHHQAAETVGAGLRISARDAEDGTVEALEYPDRPFVLGVQWHPEDLIFQFPEQLKLFQQFGAATG